MKTPIKQRQTGAEQSPQAAQTLKRGRRELTRKQKIFVNAILDNPKITGELAARKAYDVTDGNTARALASENLTKPNIIQYLKDHAEEAEYAVFKVMKSSLNQRNDPQHASVALRAADSILDRVHGKATQKIEQTSAIVQINIDLSGE